MSTRIVIVNTALQLVPSPETLQQTVALVSQGGTSLGDNAFSYLTQLSDLTPLLSAALSVTGIAQSAGLATATTAAAHGVADGDTFLTTISGASQAAYNGTFLATSTGTDTFTYAVPSGTASPATGTILYTPRGVAELIQEATTYFAQGNQIGASVLEVGAGEPSAGISALAAYITANPNTDYEPGATGYFYVYQVPRSWDGVSAFLTLLADYESDEAMTYFSIVTTTGTYSDYTDLMKSGFAFIQAPNTTPVEFDASAMLYGIAQYDPTNQNQVTSMSYRYVFGVTPYPTNNNSALLQELMTAGINVIGTGAQGGISEAVLNYGTTLDGNDFKFWYSVDWAQLNVAINLANAVINGSNNPSNPLRYSQAGINVLVGVAQQVFNDGVAFGMFLSTTAGATANGQPVPPSPTVTAIPFYDYVADNPSDYADEVYKGLACTAVPQNGFRNLVFNFTVSEFPAGGTAVL